MKTKEEESHHTQPERMGREEIASTIRAKKRRNWRGNRSESLQKTSQIFTTASVGGEGLKPRSRVPAARACFSWGEEDAQRRYTRESEGSGTMEQEGVSGRKKNAICSTI